MTTLAHPAKVSEVHERMLRESSAEGRFITISSGHKIHVTESGTGPALVMLHGTGTAAYSMLPLMDHLSGVRAIAPDRPGNGLSDPVAIGHRGYRAMAVEVTGQILDALELDQVVLVGSSGGSVWAIWYALAHPERISRLIMAGSVPLLPGTHAPFPLRLMTTPVIGNIMARMPANEKTVQQIMAVMGEGKTIVNHPNVLKGLVASNNDPLASKTSREEFSAFLNLFGFRSSMKIHAADLARLHMPTLIIWGTGDPIGDEKAAIAAAEAIPNSTLELMPTGHVPWLGHTERVARLISDFVR